MYTWTPAVHLCSVVQHGVYRCVQNLSTIPLGHGGIQLPHDDHSEKSRNYHEHPINAAENNAATWRAKLSNNGPTSTVGVTVGGWVR